jgi:hypothetical protein
VVLPVVDDETQRNPEEIACWSWPLGHIEEKVVASGWSSSRRRVGKVAAPIGLEFNPKLFCIIISGPI